MNKKYNRITLFLLFCWSLTQAGNQEPEKLAIDQSAIDAIDTFEEGSFFPAAPPPMAELFAIVDSEAAPIVVQAEDFFLAPRKQKQDLLEAANNPNDPDCQPEDDGDASTSRATKRRVFHCQHEGCGKSFAQYSNLRRHIESIHKRIIFTCPEEGCDKSFKARSNLDIHIKITHEGKQFTCKFDDCGKVFRSPHGLSRHVKAVHEKIRFNCPEDGCSKSFKFADNLKRHIKEQHDPLDGLNLETAVLEQQSEDSSLASRKRNHDSLEAANNQNDPDYQPEAINDDSGASTSGAPKRRVSHCQFKGCGKVFTECSVLSKHIRSVHKKVRFSCPKEHCSASFTQSSSLEQHIKSTHEGRRFNCPFVDCGKVFRSSYGLSRHVKSFHEKIRFNCLEDGCSKSFKFADTLKTHIKMHHKVYPLDRLKFEAATPEQQSDLLSVLLD